MMKFKIISLLLLFATIPLYSLTDTDWRMIYSLRTGSMLAGAATGGVLGYTTGTFIGRRVVPTTAKKIGTYVGEIRYAPSYGTIETADQRQLREIPKKQLRKSVKRDFQQSFRQSKFNPVTLTPTGIIVGGKFGYLGGERLAIAYIARKYGVDAHTARQAIETNLDLSEELKK
jgi:hypothetical protein